MIITLICAGPSGGVACHGAATSRVFAIYEFFEVMVVVLSFDIST